MNGRQQSRGRSRDRLVDPSVELPPASQRRGNSKDFGQLALWAAASLAGLVSVVLAARTPFFKSMQKRLSGGGQARSTAPRRQMKKPNAAQSLPMLAEAIVGNTRGAIADVFGIPRSAVLCGTTATATTAETWYYALERDEPLAMAIEFDQDWARHVEFFKAPRV